MEVTLDSQEKIQETPSGLDFWILGSPIFKPYVGILNIQESWIGFSGFWIWARLWISEMPVLDFSRRTLDLGSGGAKLDGDSWILDSDVGLDLGMAASGFPLRGTGFPRGVQCDSFRRYLERSF